jgi:signal transduction histidine kinase
MRVLLFASLFLTAAAGLAQMDGMTDRQKVEYINKNFYQLYSADLNNALELTKWAAETAQANQWDLEEAYAQMGWGVVTYLGGDYANVLPKYLRSLALFETLNHKPGIIAVNNEMGVFYHKQNDLKNCFQSLDRAEQLAREIGDLEKLGTNLGHRGAILSRQNRLPEAKRYYLEVYEIRKKTNDSVGLGYVLLDLAELATHDHKYADALAHIDESTAIRTQIGDRYGLAVNSVTKGETYLKASNVSDAIVSLESGLQEARSVGYTDLIRFTCKLLAETYAKSGNFEHAYQYLNEFNHAKDSLFSVEKAKAITELQTAYETEKKEARLAEQERQLAQSRWLIAGLCLVVGLVIVIVWIGRQQILARQKQRLAEQEKEFQKKLTESVIELQERDRARLARDLHDGLGQMISAVQLCIQQPTEATRAQADDTLRQMHGEIRNIVFELLPRTLVDEGLLTSLNELATRINTTGKIQLHVNANQRHRPDPKLEVSLYRICQEWINNVLKHARATAIEIYLNQSDQEYIITIEDNGPGFDPGALTLGKGNGWKNIQSRVRLHNGDIFVDSTPGNTGSTLVISIPLAAWRQVA